MDLHDQAGPRERTKLRFHHPQTSHSVSIASPDRTAPLSQMHHGPQMTRHLHMPQISEHDQTAEHERGPGLVLALAPEQEKIMSPREETYLQKIVHQIESIVEQAAIDGNSKSEWRTYMENYSKVTSYLACLSANHCMKSLLTAAGKLQHFQSSCTTGRFVKVAVSAFHLPSYRGRQNICVQ
jgi:hypothetical protein